MSTSTVAEKKVTTAPWRKAIVLGGEYEEPTVMFIRDGKTSGSIELTERAGKSKVLTASLKGLKVADMTETTDENYQKFLKVQKLFKGFTKHNATAEIKESEKLMKTYINDIFSK